MKRSTLGFLAALALPMLFAACQERGAASNASRYVPTNLPPVMPSGDFQAYIEGARGHVAAVNMAAGTPIPDEEVAAVGPFELRPAPEGENCRGAARSDYDRGVLLIHGLNDTPFSMWDLAARFAKACYLVRAILLPGHGTVPGDLLNVGLPAWREAVERAIWSFRGEADRLVIAGMDLGANLALDAAFDVTMPPEVELNGIVMLAPAFDYEPPTFAPAAIGPGGTALWGEVFDKHSSFRYNSVAKPSITAANQLGRELFQREAPLHLPTFMVLSAEDAVADAARARDWYCGQRAMPRHLLWYSRYPNAPFPPCECTVTRRDRPDERRICVSIRPSSCVTPISRETGSSLSPSPENCRTNPYETENGDAGRAILDIAHIALLAAPDNPRYGASAPIKDCLHYSWEKDTPEGQVCAGLLSDGEGTRYLRYGEMSESNLENYILRRLTYNPDFDHMTSEMIDFLERSN